MNAQRKDRDVKGIILAGGAGTRLQPLTHVISKQLLPVYDKPLVYYPLATLMLAGIQDILIITTPEDISNFQKLLGDGGKYGISITYAEQSSPKGIADAFLIAEYFINGCDSVLILGDNIFHGPGFGRKLKESCKEIRGAKIFVKSVRDPKRFGVVNVDHNGMPIEIIEKPEFPKSDLAVTGLYFFNEQVVEIAKTLKPSARGELEITAINNIYLREKVLEVEYLNRNHTWLDTGTHESLLDASNFVRSLEVNNLFKLACLEEIAFSNGWISYDELNALALNYGESSYGIYLRHFIEGIQE